jgi:hypothetical protein
VIDAARGNHVTLNAFESLSTSGVQKLALLR